MVANLTAKTSGSISVNECHSVYRYTWNSSPIATTTGAWFAGIAKDSPVETVTDSIKYRIGTNNTLFSSKLVIDRDGNVGIGTTSPTQRLDVSGNVNATGVGVGLSNESLLNSLGSVIIESPAIDTVAQIQQGIFPAGNGQLALVGGINEFGNTAGNGSLMVFCGSTKADGTDNYRSFGMIGAFKENHINEDRAGYLALGSRSNVAPTDEIIEHMRITSNGDVIISNDKSAVLSLKSGDGTNIDCLINMYENDNLRWTLRNQGDDNDRFHIQNLDEDGITVVKRFTILKDGKVGIGKASPTEKLDVSGNVNAEHYYVNSTPGFNGSFTVDGVTVTVTNGIITNVV
jgi:hypothetical protein